jgi:hypothetical protein
MRSLLMPLRSSRLRMFQDGVGAKREQMTFGFCPTCAGAVHRRGVRVGESPGRRQLSGDTAGGLRRLTAAYRPSSASALRSGALEIWISPPNG